MASPTKIVEGKRKHKRDKRLKARMLRVRKELAKEAKAAHPALRHLVPGVRKGA